METILPTQEEHHPPTAGPVQANEVAHKYKYTIFDSFAGERYLYSLAQKFAPIACWRTWWAAVSFQIPGESCYVGIPRLTDERDGSVGVKERKIQKDLQALEARGWLRQQQVLRTFKTRDDRLVTRAVPDKDFEGFYDTAYAYHQWLESSEYIAPLRENLPLLLADPTLIKRLIRFENYRRLLINAKPGRKARISHQDFYTCQLALLEQKSGENGQDEQDEPKPNQYFNTFTNEDSLYRRPSNNQSTNRYEDSEDSTAGEEEEVVAIRRFNPKSITTPHPSNSDPNPIPQEAQGGEAAKEVKGLLGYTEAELKQNIAMRGAAMAGIPADQYAKLHGGQDQTEREEATQRQQEWLFEEQPEPTLPARPEREVPVAVIEVGRQYARLYDDPHLIPSDVTRFKKLFSTASQALPGFQDAMYWERFDGAKAAADKRARKRTNSKGYVTRVPYLFTCLENAFAFSLEELVYLRSDESFYADYTLIDVINNMRATYYRSCNPEQSTIEYRSNIEYRTWLCDILDEYEKRKEPKVRLNATTRL